MYSQPLSPPPTLIEQLHRAWRSYWSKYSPTNTRRMLAQGKLLNPALTHTLARTIYDGFNPLYLVMSAVRGPDMEHGFISLKEIFTARIRAIVLDEEPHGHCGSYCTKPLMLSELERIRPSEHLYHLRNPENMHYFNCFEHWSSHMIEAIALTAGHPIWNGLEAAAISALLELRKVLSQHACQASLAMNKLIAQVRGVSKELPVNLQ